MQKKVRDYIHLTILYTNHSIKFQCSLSTEVDLNLRILFFLQIKFRGLCDFSQIQKIYLCGICLFVLSAEINPGKTFAEIFTQPTSSLKQNTVILFLNSLSSEEQNIILIDLF